MTKTGLFIRSMIVGIGLVAGVVIATQITSSNIWTTSATNGDVITADAWNALVTKAKSAGGACSTEGAINCSISSPSTSYVNSWSCKYGFDTVNKKCKGPSGICGSDSGKLLISAPTNLCSLGTPSSVTDNGLGNTYAWTCNGSDGGTNTSCSATHSNYCIKGASSCTVTAANKCNWFKERGFDSGDGTYWIDPDGSGGSAPYQIYCDMTTDGGGWTLITKFNTTNAIHSYAAAGGDLTTTSSIGKLSDTHINAMNSTGSIFRFTCGTTKRYVIDSYWAVEGPGMHRSIYYSTTYSSGGVGFSLASGSGGDCTYSLQWCTSNFGMNYNYEHSAAEGCYDGASRGKGGTVYLK